MSFLTRFSLATASSLLPLLASAQTPPAAPTTTAAAARDSVLLQAAQARQALEQRTSSFEVKARRVGRRRLVTRGYARLGAPAGTAGQDRLLWKKVLVHRRNGGTLEKFSGYQSRHTALRETRHNGHLSYLKLMRYQTIPFKSKPAAVLVGQLTADGYVRWKNQYYILPAHTL